MSSSGSSSDQMRKELEELLAETARLREQSKLLEQRIQQLAAQCEQMQAKPVKRGDDGK